MSIDASDLDLETLKRQAGFANILAGYLESGVSILDEDLNYMFISDSVYESLGITRDRLVPGDPLSKCHELMAENGMLTPEMLKKQALSSKEQKARNNSDQAEIARLVTLGNGTTHRFVRKPLPCGKTISIADDVSELVEKDKLLDKALFLGEAGYWSLDVATKTYTISNSLYEFFGEAISAKIKMQGIIAGIHPDDRAGFRSALKNASQTDNRFTMTCRALTDKPEEHWTDIRGEVIRDLSGKAIRLEAFVKDVTAQRQQAVDLERAKDEAVAASHAKSEFLANMSHEIRTPMNGILGMAELLSSSEINDRQREFVSVINSSASALLTIINDILDFSKIEAGAFEIDPISFDLKSSINDVASLVLGPAQEKNLELIINYSSDLPKNFIGDAGRIRQIITNLVGNAVKFTEKGHITIDVDIQTNRGVAICTIDVIDTGIGICVDKMEQIFEKFTQADGSTTRVYGGTGLGLTISKRIVEMMGGRMRVESTLGEGSSFGFRIPLPIDEEAKTEAYDSSLIANKRALIVDDITINRSLFGEQLRAWRIESDTAVDGVEALTKMKKAQDEGRPYDLILLDFLMPGMNGHEFAQFVSSTATIESPQIIMLSSCDQPVSTAALNKIGIDSYLIKPVRERRLFDTIVRSLSKKSESHPAQALAVEENTEQAIVKTTTSKKQEILVAEDFDLNQDVVKLMLGETLFQPIFVNNGQEAVDLYCANPHRFPLVLMDVSMPIMDGYQATESIRAYEVENGLTPVSIVALTGHALKNDRDDCLKSGMNDYLTKPVKQTALLEKLEFYINNKAEARQSA